MAILKEVTGTKGNWVTYELLGTKDVIDYMNQVNQRITTVVQAQLVTEGVFMENEVKASIAGNRAEPKSVDTGQFINDVEMRFLDRNTVEIAARKTSYAKYLEYGTSRLPARRHFRNSEARNRKKINKHMTEAIRKAIASCKSKGLDPSIIGL